MEVVNVKVKFIRPQYQNLREWMANPENVYIGRKNVVFVDGSRFPPNDSFWSNPYKIGKDGSRDEVIEKYRYHLNRLLSEHPDKIIELKDKILGCWCAPDACHGDIIIQSLSGAKIKKIDFSKLVD